MGKQIIETSPGKFAIFSSVVDDFVAYDGTKEQIINYFKHEAAKRAEIETERIFSVLEEGGKPYHQFTQTLEEMLDTVKDCHGEEEYETRKKELGL